MKNMIRSAFVAVFSLAAMVAPALADKWELLGSREVSLDAERDEIKVGRNDGRFKKIQLRVRGNDVEMLDLKVVYGNGRVDDIRVREVIRQGGETRGIDLRGEQRVIDRIVLAYRRPANGRGKAVVEVYGK
ncbi:MAG: DUF2541 family protein [Hyphomicrobiales bacterium]|nr:DUF2541 family protein [Hyphomicrobiales bacterium]